MATGSGKTLVLVKLIEILWKLIQRSEIPPHDILILSCRDDLLEQLKKHIHEFNAARSDLLYPLAGIEGIRRCKAVQFVSVQGPRGDGLLLPLRQPE